MNIKQGFSLPQKQNDVSMIYSKFNEIFARQAKNHENLDDREENCRRRQSNTCYSKYFGEF